MFVCKICGTEVKAGQAFCSTCGANVVDNYETVCPICSTKNAAGSRYCGKCGGILGVLRKPICAVCGVSNLPGAKFCVSCGAPIVESAETHSDSDMLDARKRKQRLDNMERERMEALDKEIAAKRSKTLEEKEDAIAEVEQYRAKTNEELAKQARMLDAYREKLNELGSEDVALLRKISSALRNYSVYYADPYTQIDEDDIERDSYVCPSCGTINPLNVIACTHCGRNKARATLLLAKGKIKQSPPVKRKADIIPAPEQNLDKMKVPTFDEFAGEDFEKAQEKPIETSSQEEKKEAPANFSQPYMGGYPYGFPFAQPYPTAGGYAPMLYNEKTGEPYQMPPIVQPVAFVPYVTQEQPLMQYSPAVEPAPTPTKQPIPEFVQTAQPQVQPRKKK